jgi:anaerobic ribonucleoside-triphosphate reductase
MKATIETVKIEMTINDAVKLKEELKLMINDISSCSESLAGYFDEAKLRECYPKVNEFLNVLNINNDELPF